MLLPRRLAQAIIVLVSIIWAANFGLQFIPALDWKPDVSINGIFMGVVGGALALSRKSHKDDDHRRHGEDDEDDSGDGLTPPRPPEPPQPPPSPEELQAAWEAYRARPGPRNGSPRPGGGRHHRPRGGSG